jgi:cell volume regulation protein A
MHIGWRRVRTAAGPVVWVGVAGTFVTAAALATLAHARAPYKGEIERFHSALASLAEIVAFLVLASPSACTPCPTVAPWGSA